MYGTSQIPESSIGSIVAISALNMPCIFRSGVPEQRTLPNDSHSHQQRGSNFARPYSRPVKQLRAASGLPAACCCAVTLCLLLLASHATAQPTDSTASHDGYDYSADPDAHDSMYTSDAHAWRSGSTSSSSTDFHTARYERDLVTGTTRQLYSWYTNASHPTANTSSLSAKARCLAEGFSRELKDRSVFSQVGRWLVPRCVRIRGGS